MDFETAIIPYLPELSAYCRRLCGSKWDGEDLAQETILRTYAHWMKQRPVANAKAFLLRTARNIWIDENRKYRSRITLVDQGSLCQAGKLASGFTDIRLLLEEAANKVSLRYLELILLSNLYGYSMEEIARLTHNSVSGVKCALHRARKLVRSESKPRAASKMTEEQLDEWTKRIFEQFSA